MGDIDLDRYLLDLATEDWFLIQEGLPTERTGEFPVAGRVSDEIQAALLDLFERGLIEFVRITDQDLPGLRTKADHAALPRLTAEEVHVALMDPAWRHAPGGEIWFGATTEGRRTYEERSKR